MLARVLGTSVDHVHAELGKPSVLNWWSVSEAPIVFLHDRVQEAAYPLVPESDRGREHLRIGRLILAHTPPEKREETIFEIVNQLNRGATLMTSPDEREQLSRSQPDCWHHGQGLSGLLGSAAVLRLGRRVAAG